MGDGQQGPEAPTPNPEDVRRGRCCCAAFALVVLIVVISVVANACGGGEAEKPRCPKATVTGLPAERSGVSAKAGKPRCPDLGTLRVAVTVTNHAPSTRVVTVGLRVKGEDPFETVYAPDAEEVRAGKTVTRNADFIIGRYSDEERPARMSLTLSDFYVERPEPTPAPETDEPSVDPDVPNPDLPNPDVDRPRFCSRKWWC